MRSATVVLPVPGLPVNDMCSVGGVGVRPSALADALDQQQRGDLADALLHRRQADELAGRAVAAIGRCRRPRTPCGDRLVSLGSDVVARDIQHRHLEKELRRRGERRSSASASDRSRECSARSEHGSVGARAIGRVARWCSGSLRPADLLRIEPEPAPLRPVDDEGDPHRFPAMAGIEAEDADVAVAIDLAALVELHHHAGGVLEIEHRQAPHLPIGVAGMRIVGELDVHRPALVEAILHLRGDLSSVRSGRNEKQPWVSRMINVSSHGSTLAVGTKSGVSVDS